jgi:hypothetical protein
MPSHSSATPNLSISYQKYGFGIRDPGSGKNVFRIANPESKRHRIPDPEPQQWVFLTIVMHRRTGGRHSHLRGEAGILREVQRVLATRPQSEIRTGRLPYHHLQNFLDRVPAPDPEAPNAPFIRIKLVLVLCPFYLFCSKVSVILLRKKSKNVGK